MKTEAPSLFELFLNRQLASAEVPFFVCKERSSLEGFKHLPSYPFLQSPQERIDTAMMFPVADAQLEAWQPTLFQQRIMDGYLELYSSFIHDLDELTLEQEDKPSLKALGYNLQKAKDALGRSDFPMAFRNLQRLELSLVMLSHKLDTALFPYDYLPVAFALGLVDLALGDEKWDTSAARARFETRLRELFRKVEADTEQLLESYRAADDIDTAMSLASLVDKRKGTHLAEDLEDIRQLKEQVQQSLQKDLIFLAKLKEQLSPQDAVPGN